MGLSLILRGTQEVPATHTESPPMFYREPFLPNWFNDRSEFIVRYFCTDGTEDEFYKFIDDTEAGFRTKKKNQFHETSIKL